jgi:hypothetical protein
MSLRRPQGQGPSPKEIEQNTHKIIDRINGITEEMLNIADRPRLEELNNELLTIKSFQNCVWSNCKFIDSVLGHTKNVYKVGKIRIIIDDIIRTYNNFTNKTTSIANLQNMILELNNINKPGEISVDTILKIKELIDKVNKFLAQNNSRRYQNRSRQYADIAHGNYHQKYLKYKTKYLELKKQLNITN